MFSSKHTPHVFLGGGKVVLVVLPLMGSFFVNKFRHFG